MKTETEITGIDEVIIDLVGDPVGTRAVLLSGERTIEISLEDRQISLLRDEALHVQDRETDERSTDL